MFPTHTKWANDYKKKSSFLQKQWCFSLIILLGMLQVMPALEAERPRQCSLATVILTGPQGLLTVPWHPFCGSLEHLSVDAQCVWKPSSIQLLLTLIKRVEFLSPFPRGLQ